MDKDNIVQFPEREHEEEDVHKCDSCASYAVHRITVEGFEEIDDESVVGECLDKVFEAIDEENEDGIIDAVYEMFWAAFDQGYKKHIKNEIHTLSAKLHMLCAEPDGDEQ